MRIIRHKKPVPSYWIPYFSDSDVLYEEGPPDIDDEWFELNPESVCYLFSEDLCGPKDEAAEKVREYLDNPDEYIAKQVERLTGMAPEPWFVAEARIHISDYLTSEIEGYWYYIRKELRGE